MPAITARRKREKAMGKVTRVYENVNNGGRERITRVGNRYWVSSDLRLDRYYSKPEWTGFSDPVEVSREKARELLSFTKAPQDVVEAILHD